MSKYYPYYPWWAMRKSYSFQTQKWVLSASMRDFRRIYIYWVNISLIIPDARCVKVTHFRLKNEYFKLRWGNFGKIIIIDSILLYFAFLMNFILKKGLFQEIYLCSPGHGRSLNLFAVYPTNESWWKRKIGISCSQLFQIMNYLPITTNFKHFNFLIFSDG